jgi:hypothetical protein
MVFTLGTQRLTNKVRGEEQKDNESKPGKVD